MLLQQPVRSLQASAALARSWALSLKERTSSSSARRVVRKQQIASKSISTATLIGMHIFFFCKAGRQDATPSRPWAANEASREPLDFLAHFATCKMNSQNVTQILRHASNKTLSERALYMAQIFFCMAGRLKMIQMTASTRQAAWH